MYDNKLILVFSVMNIILGRIPCEIMESEVLVTAGKPFVTGFRCTQTCGKTTKVH